MFPSNTVYFLVVLSAEWLSYEQFSSDPCITSTEHIKYVDIQCFKIDYSHCMRTCLALN